MRQRFGVANRVWVMARGMASAKNVAWLSRDDRQAVCEGVDCGLRPGLRVQRKGGNLRPCVLVT